MEGWTMNTCCRCFTVLFLCVTLQASAELYISNYRLDNADRAAIAEFSKIRDENERMLMHNGALHDVTRHSNMYYIWMDEEKIRRLSVNRSRLVFVHKHPYTSLASLYPTNIDYQGVVKMLYRVYRVNQAAKVEFRVVTFEGRKTHVLSYGLKPNLVKQIKQLALARSLVASRQASTLSLTEKGRLLNEALTIDRAVGNIMRDVKRTSFHDYLKYGCYVSILLREQLPCSIHPQEFSQESEEYFLSYR